MKMRSPQSLTIAGITAVAVACVLGVAVQDTRASDANARPDAKPNSIHINDCR
jgi:hypothetical protein